MEVSDDNILTCLFVFAAATAILFVIEFIIYNDCTELLLLILLLPVINKLIAKLVHIDNNSLAIILWNNNSYFFSVNSNELLLPLLFLLFVLQITFGTVVRQDK